MIDLNMYLGQCDYISRFSDFGWRNVISKFQLPCDLLINIKIYLGQCDSVWPIFHRSVFLPNTWKTI